MAVDFRTGYLLILKTLFKNIIQEKLKELFLQSLK